VIGLRLRKPKALWSYVFVILLVAAVFGAAGLPYAIGSRDARDRGYEAVPTALGLPPGMVAADLQPATVTEVIDGDTIRVEIGGEEITIRYYGIDAPEAGERCYRESKTRNEQILANKEVLVLPDLREVDRFGRTLRYVFLPTGVSLEATLAAEGFAHAWRSDGYYKNEIIRLEEEADELGRGCLWTGDGA
jgi:micrococcal nuclease